MSATYKIPSWNTAWSMNFLYITILLVILSSLVSYYSVKSISDENPANTIRPSIPKISSFGFVEKLSIWNRLSFNIRWNWRDAKRNKFRALMTIVGVVGCTALLVSAFGMYDGMND